MYHAANSITYRALKLCPQSALKCTLVTNDLTRAATVSESMNLSQQRNLHYSASYYCY